MPAWVALLRGINVGGKHALPMAKVRTACEAIGATSVATYIQSGNIVLRHAQRSVTLAKQLASPSLSSWLTGSWAKTTNAVTECERGALGA